MTYQAEVTREGRWWMIRVPSIDALTQARNVAEVPLMARELIAVHEGKKLDDVGVSVSYLDINGVDGERVSGLADERRATDAVVKAIADRTAGLARDLVAAHIPLRDIAQLLGISHQRVHQIVTEPAVAAGPEGGDVVDLVAALRQSVERARETRDRGADHRSA